MLQQQRISTERLISKLTKKKRPKSRNTDITSKCDYLQKKLRLFATASQLVPPTLYCDILLSNYFHLTRD